MVKFCVTTDDSGGNGVAQNIHTSLLTMKVVKQRQKVSQLPVLQQKTVQNICEMTFGNQGAGQENIFR